jgi:hypothetical protein
LPEKLLRDFENGIENKEAAKNEMGVEENEEEEGKKRQG